MIVEVFPNHQVGVHQNLQRHGTIDSASAFNSTWASRRGAEDGRKCVLTLTPLRGVHQTRAAAARGSCFETPNHRYGERRVSHIAKRWAGDERKHNQGSTVLPEHDWLTGFLPWGTTQYSWKEFCLFCSTSIPRPWIFSLG